MVETIKIQMTTPNKPDDANSDNAQRVSPKPTGRKLILPVEFNRRFSLHFYFVSHRVLLLRSGKTNERDTRIDILFGFVR